MCGRADRDETCWYNAKPAERQPLPHTVEDHDRGARRRRPPSIEAMEAQGFNVTHVYGLTEVLWPGSGVRLEEGNGTRCRSVSGARAQGAPGRALPRSRTGLMVADPTTMTPVPADGRDLGRGVSCAANIVMKGYLKNQKGDRRGFRGRLVSTPAISPCSIPTAISSSRTRSKDIIISGGRENISTIEVESVALSPSRGCSRHAVGRAPPDATWGETVCAFRHAQGRRAGERRRHHRAIAAPAWRATRCPRTVVFGGLPKTSTGKIQKFLLRDRAKALS